MAGSGAKMQNRPVRETPPSIRPAAAAESAVLQGIEVAAGLRFVEVGLDEVAARAPPSIADLEEYRRRRRSWVATDGEDRPVAFLLTSVVDGNAHIDEVSVHPTRSRRGIGRALIEHVVDEAGRHGRPAVTLTTFTQVPWNAPYYSRCGFHPMDDAELGTELARIRRAERLRGLDAHPRIAMIRPV